ncbi:MAG TPA: 7TM diverse intracellular signaling domain-containing protein [Leptospiraceae bacterium]|nr:7TM diverse intracellular signaling domain-containing protein [Leptospiraceae bacterium]HMW05075.1 7TM diverse intracellular signaling domain-containing protein [Leptospiraceae bacterium]HMX34010.1 7TM diverse intracellular signaling domain-containing protein [Leptospiraceae bacterium]HMY31628.1 7TM diverse intracellular signaling domain-containing protein [Leptospiraceae bacterium]HMZ62628.1 7TM diverse intracellular signaling domain-containing protein [Leptospiraceae bacterium]
MLKLCYLILLFFYFPLFADSETPIFELKSSEFTTEPLPKYIYYLEDTSSDLDIEKVQTPEIQEKFQAPKPDLSFGFKKNPYWFKWTVKNHVDRPIPWTLEIGYPMLDHIELYIPEEDGKFTTIVEGDEKPFYERKVYYRNFLFELQEKPNSDRTYYIKIITTSSLSFPIQAWTPRALTEKINTEQTLLGMSYGIIFIMIFYNLFILLSTRDRSYMYYILFVLFYGSFLTTLNGVAYEYLWPNQVWWANHCLPFFINGGSLFGLMFGRNFLNLKTSHPKYSIWIRFLMILAFIGGILSLLASYSLAIKIATALAGVTVGTLLIAGILGVLKKYRPARYYLIAWFALILGIASYSLKAFGLLPTNFFTHWGVQIGAVMEMFLLSLALGDKINTLKAEKEKAQKELNIAYGRFVPHEFLNFLEKKSILDVNLGDQVLKSMTILFCDIRSFTSLSESMTPEENFNFINDYLGRVVPVFRKNNGIVDKFIGDGIMALFPGRPEDAVCAALEFLNILRVYNQERISSNLTPIRVGIGIHCGPLMLGTIGHEEFMQGSVISDSVNLASRIEELTKKVGATVLISEGVLNELGDSREKYNIRYIGNIRVKGKVNNTKVYEIFDGDSEEIRNLKLVTREDFGNGVEFFYKKEYQTAKEFFQKVVRKFPEDKATITYLSRLNEDTL